MANTQLFQSLKGMFAPDADTVNLEGAPAYVLSPKRSIFKQRNPDAKLVCIDIAPYGTTQAADRNDILNIGGFSDDVFKIIAAFSAGQLGAAHWVGEIESIAL